MPLSYHEMRFLCQPMDELRASFVYAILVSEKAPQLADNPHSAADSFRDYCAACTLMLPKP